MARPRRDQNATKAFGKRLLQSMEQNPNFPPKGEGQRTWFVEQMLKLGVPVGVETIRKWCEGEAMPAPDKFQAIAEALRVDTQWLMFGEDVVESTSAAHSYAASALTNLVAGIIGMDGGVVSFPDESRGGKDRAHLHAVVRGVNYPLHIVGGEVNDNEFKFRIPTHRDGVIVLGVVRREGEFAFDLYEIEEEMIDERGEYARGAVEVSARATDLKQIKTFTERL